jgi:hypothetical protein
MITLAFIIGLILGGVIASLVFAICNLTDEGDHD